MSSEVYISRFSGGETDGAIASRTRELFRASGMERIVPAGALVALKTHFGETGNTSYLRREFIEPLISEVKEGGGRPLFVETSALYQGDRANAVDHLETARKHGFSYEETGCPIVFVDGLKGSFAHHVEVNLKHFERVAVAGDFPLVPAAFIISHLTGHDLAGFGGAIKNVAMGLAARSGKMQQHQAGEPQILHEDRIACGTCAEWCPVNAIAVGEVAEIDYGVCIGCGQCLTVCPVGAVDFSWDEDPRFFNEKMAEYALGILKGREESTGFITFMLDVTEDCNCAGKEMDTICPDVGVLASTDPVAIDQAALDLAREATGRDLFKEQWPDSYPDAQVRHGAEIGLGSRDYELKEVGAG